VPGSRDELGEAAMEHSVGDEAEEGKDQADGCAEALPTQPLVDGEECAPSSSDQDGVLLLNKSNGHNENKSEEGDMEKEKKMEKEREDEKMEEMEKEKEKLQIEMQTKEQDKEEKIEEDTEGNKEEEKKEGKEEKEGEEGEEEQNEEYGSGQYETGGSSSEERSEASSTIVGEKRKRDQTSSEGSGEDTVVKRRRESNDGPVKRRETRVITPLQPKFESSFALTFAFPQKRTAHHSPNKVLLFYRYVVLLFGV